MNIQLSENKCDRFWNCVHSSVIDIVGYQDAHTLFPWIEFSNQEFSKSRIEENSRSKVVNFGHLQFSIQQLYGTVSGLGIACRIGQALFPYILREFGDILGFDSNDYRLMPTHLKMYKGLQTLSGLFFQLIGFKSVCLQDQSYWYWNIQDCPWCLEKTSETSLCYFPVGIIQSFSYWASGGRYYSVMEGKCHAMRNEYCQIMINKIPLRMH